MDEEQPGFSVIFTMSLKGAKLIVAVNCLH